MSDIPEDEEENWFRPVWETEDELDPPGQPRPRKQPLEPDYHHPLLTPLARAQDALARLEAKAEMASATVAEGLRARLSYLEAAGWLGHAHIWINRGIWHCGTMGWSRPMARPPVQTSWRPCCRRQWRSMSILIT